MNYTLKNKIYHAAEAIVYREGDKIIKKRVRKGYRLKDLDDLLIKQRNSIESKVLDKLKRCGLNVPTVYSIDKDSISMSFVEGEQVKDVLNESDYVDIIKKVSEQVTKLHDVDVVHGDLTTSNMILSLDRVFLIDFGLAQNSKKIEDKAVDVYLFKQALESKHHSLFGSCFELFLENYKPKDREKILLQLKSIEKRRRYKGGS